MAKYVPFLSPIRLLVNLHKGLSITTVLKNRQKSFILIQILLHTKAEMEKLSKSLSKEQIDKVFARFDADGDGRLSYAEFRKMMNK